MDSISPQQYTKWSDRLAFDVAMALEDSCEPIAEILARHSLSASDLITFNSEPLFRRKVGQFRDEIRNKGLTFRMKARTQAEELLTTSWMLIHSPDVSAAVKADLIKSTVKWGGLEPKGEVLTDSAGGVSITINLAGSDTPKMVDVTPEETEEKQLVHP